MAFLMTLEGKSHWQEKVQLVKAELLQMLHG